MTRTRSLFSAALLASVALAGVALNPLILPLANAQVPSFQPPPVERATFAASIAGLVMPTTGVTDAFCVSGSATKIVRIKRIDISGIDATAQLASVNLVLRSTANSGGTSTSPAVVPMDANNAAGTAVAKAYTVAPTAGTSIGAVRSQSLGLTAAAPFALTWSFDPTQLQQEIVLRGVAQSACVNFPAAFTTAGPTINVDVTWTE